MIMLPTCVPNVRIVLRFRVENVIEVWIVGWIDTSIKGTVTVSLIIAKVFSLWAGTARNV